ncbi:nuclear transport factor 2 family protein [Mycolicibacterium gadium]|uniref:Nuclear transport factor 2 family protein n=1 Tax=Mycolicibacterium gadium TaxID=1794 RepID=A0ABT6GW12_MYCGU|nr:nuclear transport factor 2 family protein [Mycolicibacterium gadium]MDG5485948.1 nuclear transport factor 2 family protein [Mycolicibacterium gadium]
MPDLDRRLAKLLSLNEIRELAYKYAAAVESRDVDAMAKLFSPSARFGSYGDGPDGLRRLMVDSMTGSLFAVILVANHLVEFDDDVHARGQVWAHCYAQERTEGFLDQLIKYEDAYEQVDGRWLFVQRRHRLWYGAAHSRSPLDQNAADWPRNQIGVGDIPLADPEFAAWWQTRSKTEL